MQNEEIEEEEEEEEGKVEEDENDKKEEEEEEKETDKEEEEEKDDDDDDDEEVYEEKDNADEEEEEAMDIVLESKSSVGSKLRSSRNTVAKRSSGHKYSRTRGRAATKVQKAVKLIKKATKPQKKNVSKAVIRKRK